MMRTDNKKHLVGRILAFGLLALVFGYLHSRGLSPVAAALVLIGCRGLFRFLYAVVSFLLTAALIAAIFAFIIF